MDLICIVLKSTEEFFVGLNEVGAHVESSEEETKGMLEDDQFLPKQALNALPSSPTKRFYHRGPSSRHPADSPQADDPPAPQWVMTLGISTLTPHGGLSVSERE